MNELRELGSEELGYVAGGDGITIVSGAGGTYIDNGSSCSPAPDGPGSSGGGVLASETAGLGIRN